MWLTERGCVMMEMPERFATSPVKMLTAQNLAEELKWSRTYVYNMVTVGTLVPQRVTRDGRFLFEPDYWTWAKKHVEQIANRMSYLGVE